MSKARRVPVGSWLVLAGVVAVALNLRTAITVVGPLIPTIREDTGASNVALGLVGTLPVLSFGLCSPLAAWVGRRAGIGRSLAGSMVLLSAAIVLRSLGTVAWLMVGTALLGIAITVGNVLLPSLIKARFAARTSQLTSAYTGLMVIAATISAGVAVPVARATSWELSAGLWAVPALLGAGVVIASLVIEGRLVPATAGGPTSPSPAGLSARQLYTNPLAWRVALFMGLQSTMFYVVIAWLPDIMIAKGMAEVTAGAMVSLLNVASLFGVFVVPLLHVGRPDQRRSTAVGVGCFVVGSALLLVPGTAVATVAVVVLGVGCGATIALALSFFSLRTAGAADAAGLSGMAQTVGYLLAAAGPVTWGAVRDATGTWTVPTVMLLVVAVLTAVTGMASARGWVLERPTSA
ncbi:MFS transporter [Euzebya sp.]|uniref:MFS transporter n=1 Tax=Euzebya sp. TaxID=1971409 RepID=UPI003512E5F8